MNTPDKTTHVTGDAVDIGYTDADYWLMQYGNEYGLCQSYANEIWHFELAVEPGEACPAPLTDATSATTGATTRLASERVGPMTTSSSIIGDPFTRRDSDGSAAWSRFRAEGARTGSSLVQQGGDSTVSLSSTAHRGPRIGPPDDRAM